MSGITSAAEGRDCIPADQAKRDVFAGHFEHCYLREGQHCSCGFHPTTAIDQ